MADKLTVEQWETIKDCADSVAGGWSWIAVEEMLGEMLAEIRDTIGVDAPDFEWNHHHVLNPDIYRELVADTETLIEDSGDGAHYRRFILCRPVDWEDVPGKVVVTRPKDGNPLVAPEWDKRWEYRIIDGWGIDKMVWDKIIEGWRILEPYMMETVYA